MKTIIHRPFMMIAGFYGAGILLDHFVYVPFNAVCLCAVVLMFLAVAFSKRALLATFCLLLSITGLGIVYTQSHQYSGEEDIRHVARKFIT